MYVAVVEVDLADDGCDFGLLVAARCEDVLDHYVGGDEVHVAVWGFYFVEAVVQTFFCEEGFEVSGCCHAPIIHAGVPLATECGVFLQILFTK